MMLAMPGTAMDGWIALYRPSARIEPEASERLAVIETQQGTRWLGVLRRSIGERGRWDVWPLLDPQAKPIASGAVVVSAAPVLWVRT